MNNTRVPLTVDEVMHTDPIRALRKENLHLRVSNAGLKKEIEIESQGRARRIKHYYRPQTKTASDVREG